MVEASSGNSIKHLHLFFFFVTYFILFFSIYFY